MKEKLLALMVLCMLVSGSVFAADVLVNGDFESGVINPNPPSSQAWRSFETGAVRHLDFVTTWAVALYGNGGIVQHFAATPGTVYTVIADVREDVTEPLTAGTWLEIRVDFFDNAWTPSDPGTLIEAKIIAKLMPGENDGSSWTEISGAIQTPAGTGDVRLVAQLIGGEPGAGIKAHVDNFTMDDAGNTLGTPSDPTPIDGAVVLPVALDLSWLNTAANGETVTVNYGTNPAILNNDISSATLVGTVNPTTDWYSTLTTPVLADSTVYYWHVSNGSGWNAWSFNTGNSAPQITPLDDLYLWLDSGSAVTTINATVADDGKVTPVTYTWQATLEDSAGTVVFDPNNTVDPTGALTTISTEATFSDTGHWTIQLTGDDGDASASIETFEVYVYGSVCEAAINDPLDYYNTNFPNGNGDINGDCETNLVDFSIFTLGYMDCLSATKPLETSGCSP